MANEFSKDILIAFDDLCEGFYDALVMSNAMSIYRTDQTLLERANDVFWRPMPYIMQSHDGSDATSDFDDVTQLSVPATIGYDKHVSWSLTATQLRDALQQGRLFDSAKQKLAADINVASLNVAALYGSLVVKRTVAATGYDDVSLCDVLMEEQAVPNWDRFIAISPRDYDAMAGNLASRYTMAGKPTTAYERAIIGENIAGFTAMKLNYAKRLTAAAGGAALTMGTRVADANFWVPKATSTAATGEKSPVDNRKQQVVWSSTTSVAAGDAFTVAEVYNVNPITKESTGQLKTFRVLSVDDATHVTITPPMISAQGASDAELQYQNCTVETEAANSAIVFLNTVTANANCFWQKDALELIPGRLVIPDDGVTVQRSTLPNGIEVTLQKQWDLKTRKDLYRVDTTFGVVCKNTEMAGIMLFSQT